MKRLLFRGAQSFEVSRYPMEDELKFGVCGVFQREEESRREELDSTPPVETTTNWFKLQVVDDDTGDPVAGIPIELRLPGGEPRSYTTDGQGKVQVNDLPEGVADILSVDDSDAYEVVSLE